MKNEDVWVMYDKMHFNSAIVVIRYLLEHNDSNDGFLWNLYGKCLDKLNRNDETVFALKKSYKTSLHSKKHLICNDIGHVYNKVSVHENAEYWYRKAIEYRSDDATSYIYLGANYLVQGRFDEAEHCFQNAIQCKEGNIEEAYLKLGLIYGAKERFSKTLECINKAIVIDPEYTSAINIREDVYAAMKYISNSNESFFKQIKILMNIVKNKLKFNGYFIAKIDFEKDKIFKYLMNIIYEKSYKYYSILLIRDYIRINPNDGPIWLLYGICLASIGRYDEAESAFKKSIKLTPKNKQYTVHNELGHLYEKKGDKKNAELSFKKSIELNFYFENGHINLGDFYYTHGCFDEAITQYHTAISIGKKCLRDSNFKLGWVYCSIEKYNKALNCFSTAFEIDSCSDEVNTAIEDTKQAIEYLNRLDMKM